MISNQLQKIPEKTFIAILLVIFGGVVLHAPFSVGFGVLWPEFSPIFKVWKELLMIVGCFLAIILLFQKKQFKILKQPIIVLIGVYILLHLILAFFSSGFMSIIAGLMIDLRYLVFFVLVYVAVKLFPDYKQLFIKVGLIGAFVVVIFGILQVFMLPKDVLRYIGYSQNTIAPYMTVDQNESFIRINSTLRGPNPLGAYIVIVLGLVLSYIFKNRIRRNKLLAGIIVLSVGGLIALWCSYSRSALLATAVSSALILAVVMFKKFSPKVLVGVGGMLILVVGSFCLLSMSGNNFVSNVFLHSNPNDGSNTNSNEGHVESLQTGFRLMLSQPFGSGVGSTGSASLKGDNPIIIENQYLFIAHEAGWLGLLTFIAIFILVVEKLWKKRDDWVCLGVMASGVGLAIIGILLPVWVDDTVSIVWWGILAVIIESGYVKSKIKQKSARTT